MTRDLDDPDPRTVARGMGIAGCAASLVGLLLFFVPFLDLLTEYGAPWGRRDDA